GPCEVENGCLVGIGSNVLHNSKLGEGSLLAAGATLVNKEIPPRSLAVGTPANVKKSLPDEGKLIGAKTAKEYSKNGKTFKEFFEKNPEYAKY
ncbi:MAG: gamma carbonic anhydrase family protein, partial [Promethearchaeota archaeon]